MRPAPDPVIRLGSGHCCVCDGVCYHIGPIRLCSIHQDKPKAER